MKRGQYEGRIVFRDLDGNMIMNRKSDPYWWDDAFIKMMIETDAREKGVKIIKTTQAKGTYNIECVVDYASRKVKR